MKKLILLLATFALAQTFPHRYAMKRVTSTAPLELTDLDSALMFRYPLQRVGDSLSLAKSGVVAGIYGDATHVPQFTVDSFGIVKSVTNITITGGGGGGGGGTVTSVGLALPASVFTVSGSPVVGMGTLTGTFNSQSANTFFTAPNGSSGTPGFRAFLPGDITFLTDSITAARTYALARIHDTADTLRSYTKGRIHDSLSVLTASRVGAEPAVAAGTSSQYWRGDKTWTTFPTSWEWAAIVGTPTTLSGYGITDALSVSAPHSANTFLAAPNGSAGAATFRPIVAADVPVLNQNTTGSAATLAVGRTIGMTGDVAWTSPSFNGSANVTANSVIQPGVVTLPKMANLAANSIIGNNTGSAATPVALTAAQTKSLLAISTSDVSGLATVATSGSASDLGTGTLPALRLPQFSGEVRTNSPGSANLYVYQLLGRNLPSDPMIPLSTTVNRLSLIGSSWGWDATTYLPLSAGWSSSLTGDLCFSDPSPSGGSGVRGVYGTVGTSDTWRIVGGATATNSGYLEIATADDAQEPIYVRQYLYGSGTSWGSVARSATLLDGSGNTLFPGATQLASSGIPTGSGSYGLRVGRSVDMGSTNSAAFMLAVPSGYGSWAIEVDNAGSPVFGLSASGDIMRTGMTGGGFVRAASGTGQLSASALSVSDLPASIQTVQSLTAGNVAVGNGSLGLIGSTIPADGPWLPLSGGKRISGWAAFDADVYPTAYVKFSGYDMGQFGINLKTAFQVSGVSPWSFNAPVSFDAPVRFSDRAIFTAQTSGHYTGVTLHAFMSMEATGGIYLDAIPSGSIDGQQITIANNSASNLQVTSGVVRTHSIPAGLSRTYNWDASASVWR